MMRFCTPMCSYAYKNNNLVVIFFKKGHGSIEWHNKRQVVNNDTFIVTNPSDGWEYLNEKKEQIDVLSIVINQKLKQEFNTYYSIEHTKLIDDPSCIGTEDYFFIEKALTTNQYPSGRLLKDIYNVSLGNQFEFLDAEELAINVLESLNNDQQRAYRFASHINVKKQSTKLEIFKRLLVAREYIHDNMESKIPLNELARISCLSKFHLYNSFRTVFRKTPHQYANSVKLFRAKELLANNKYSVGEVSDMVGFNDIHSFSKLFKKKYGLSPSIYAKCDKKLYYSNNF